MSASERFVVIDCQKVDELVRDCCGSDRREFFDSILSIFFTNTAGNIEKLTSGIADSSLTALSEAAHSLKGTSLTLGAMKLGATAEEIEAAISGEDFSQVKQLTEQLNADFELTKQEFSQYLESGCGQ